MNPFAEAALEATAQPSTADRQLFHNGAVDNPADAGSTHPADQPAPSPVTTDTAQDGTEDTDDQLTPATRNRTRLTYDQVADLRRQYAFRRTLADDLDTADDWETPRETEHALANRFGVTQSSVHDALLGLTYPDAPGPIDQPRRDAHDLFQSEKDRFGVAVASSRQRVRNTTANIQRVPCLVSVTVTVPGTEPTVVHYPSGTTVEVATYTDNDDTLED